MNDKQQDGASRHSTDQNRRAKVAGTSSAVFIQLCSFSINQRVPWSKTSHGHTDTGKHKTHLCVSASPCAPTEKPPGDTQRWGHMETGTLYRDGDTETGILYRDCDTETGVHRDRDIMQRQGRYTEMGTQRPGHIETGTLYRDGDT